MNRRYWKILHKGEVDVSNLMPGYKNCVVAERALDLAMRDLPVHKRFVPSTVISAGASCVFYTKMGSGAVRPGKSKWLLEI